MTDKLTKGKESLLRHSGKKPSGKVVLPYGTWNSNDIILYSKIPEIESKKGKKNKGVFLKADVTSPIRW